MRPPQFSKRSRRLVIVLQWIVCVALIGLSLWSMHRELPSQPIAKRQTHQKRARSNDASKIIYAEAEVSQPESFIFDPNTADSTTLLRLGLSPWQVRSIYRFRAKHGRYHNPEDFMRTPHLTVEQWEHLAPLIRIADKYRLLSETGRIPERHASYARTDTSASPSAATHPATSQERLPRDTVNYPEKYAEGTLVDLNTADTTTLKHIPGIGSYRAKKIVEYRKKLGGYVQVEQIMEACQMPDEVMDWLHITHNEVTTIDINRSSINQMMRHPYISFYLAKDIFEWRKKHGPIKDISVLLSLPSFRSEQWPLLQHYIRLGESSSNL